MTLSDVLLFSVIGVLATNQVLLRLPRWDQRMWVFWPLQSINLLVGCSLLIWGLPDLQEIAPFANWMLGLLFLFHVVSHNLRLQRARRDHRGTQSDAEAARHEQIRAALLAGESDEP